MFCTQCGKEIQEDSNFCSYCGHPTDRDVLQNKPINQKEHILQVSPIAWVKNIVGYSSWLRKESSRTQDPFSPLTYLHGMKLDDGMPLEPGVGSVTLEKCKYGLMISFPYKKYGVGLYFSEIKEITIMKGENIQESGSVLGGALLGGLLLGPVGAVIGGMTQTASKAVGTSFLIIKHKIKDKNEGALIFSINHGYKEMIHKFLKMNFNEYYRIMDN